jgi:hypothetical protein
VGDGDSKDRYDLCVSPVQIHIRTAMQGQSCTPCIPKCMNMISPEQVVETIGRYCCERTYN